MSNVCLALRTLDFGHSTLDWYQETKTATRGHWVAVLVITTGDEQWGSPAVARGRYCLLKRRHHFNDFVFSLRQLPGAIAREFTLDRALLPRLQ
jgi:hypothetical protein